MDEIIICRLLTSTNSTKNLCNAIQHYIVLYDAGD